PTMDIVALFPCLQLHVTETTFATRPEKSLKETTVGGPIQIRVYQEQLLKEFAQLLNVVIIVKTNLRTQAQAHIIFFTSDPTLAYGPSWTMMACGSNWS